jgi:membrane-associated phospholipid phosphatase
MKKVKVLGVPIYASIILMSVCLLGIIIGSFLDYDISVGLKNKTEIGTWFANYGGYFSYCLYPAAGMCLFKGLKKKNLAIIAWGLLIASYFIAVYYCNSYFGKSVRAAFNYEAGVSPFIISILSYLLWVLLLSWVPPLMYYLLDDDNPNLLIVVGAVILIAGIISDCVNLWLKQVASRPRFKYLITLDDPKSQFKNWWEMSPNLAGSNDSFKSWPSGNMTIATMMFALPLFSDVIKFKKNYIKWILYIFAFIWVILYGYNRIHMTAHFLTDVCFGTLITYLIFGVSSIIGNSALEKTK